MREVICMTDTPTRSSKEQFDRQAAHYDNQWSSWTEESLHWMIERAGCRGTERLLDVATGAGFTALGFSPFVQSVVGTDVSTGMLEQARKRSAEQGISNVEFREAPAESLPFPDGTFDLVTCRIAAHHFVDVMSFVREAARVLRSGGVLLIGDTTVPEEPEVDTWQNHLEKLRDPSHVRNYNKSEWRQFVSDAGLTVEEITDQGGAIRVPLSDWLIKAGCTSEQSTAVREMFDSAPEAAKSTFHIEHQADGEIYFTWQRILLKARKL